jgi:hypothetical protein
MRRRTAVCCGLLLALFLSGCVRFETRRSQTEPTVHDVSDEPVRVSAQGTEAAEPSAAAARDGTVYVAWVEHRGKEADVWLAHLDGEGKPLGQPARVNPNAGGATAWRGDPPTVAVSAEGAVYVGWTARDESAEHATTLYLSTSRDGGRSFGPPSKVNDDPKPCDHGMHSLAVSGDGRVYVAWLDERDIERKEADPAQAPSHKHTESNRVVYFATSADGGRTFSPNLRVAGEVCPCCKTSLDVGDDGRVYVGWRQVLPGNFRHIAVASSNDGGQTFSPPVVVSDDRWELPGCPVSGPALAAGANGSLRVLWYTAGEAGRPGLYWSESNDGGRTFLPRRVLAEAGGRGTPALLKDEAGGLTAVWEGVEGVNLAPVRMRPDGDSRVTAPAVVAERGELPAAAEVAGRVFIACGMRTGDERGVWVLKAAGEGRPGPDGSVPSPPPGVAHDEHTHEH